MLRSCIDDSADLLLVDFIQQENPPFAEQSHFPSGNDIAVENHHCSWENSLFLIISIAIFNGKPLVSLAEPATLPGSKSSPRRPLTTDLVCGPHAAS